MHEPLCKQVRHPLEPHPYDVDVNALLCIAVVSNISIACADHAAVDGSGYRPVHPTERNAVTSCSGEDKLTREDSKSVALDPEAFVNATRGRGVYQSIGGRRLAHANHYH